MFGVFLKILKKEEPHSHLVAINLAVVQQVCLANVDI
jgi:hypothetical protein